MKNNNIEIYGERWLLLKKKKDDFFFDKEEILIWNQWFSHNDSFVSLVSYLCKWRWLVDIISFISFDNFWDASLNPFFRYKDKRERRWWRILKNWEKKEISRDLIFTISFHLLPNLVHMHLSSIYHLIISSTISSHLFNTLLICF